MNRFILPSKLCAKQTLFACLWVLTGSVALAQSATPTTINKSNATAMPEWGSSAVNVFITAELLALDKQFEPAATTLWPLARFLKEPALYERVVQWAMQSKRMDLAFSAAAQWELAEPNNPKAQQMADGILLVNERFNQFGSRLSARYGKSATPPSEADLAYLQGVVRNLNLSPAQQANLYPVVLEALKPHQQLGSVQYAFAQLAGFANMPIEAIEHIRAASLASQPSIAAMGTLLQTDPSQATSAALQWTNRNPENPAAWRTLGLVYAQLKQHSNAADTFAKGIKLNPNDILMHLERMEQLRLAGKSNQARDSLLSAFALRSSITRSDVARLLAEALEDDYHYDKALVLFEQALALAKELEDKQLIQIKTFALKARQGDKASLKALLGLQSEASERVSPLFTRIAISALREQDQFEQSISLANTLTADEAIYEQALSYELMGQHKKAEELLRDALSRNPKAAHLLNTLGYGLVDRNTSPSELAEGTAMLEAALQASPNSAAIMDSLGWAYFRAKNYPKAQALLQKAYDLKRDPEVAAHLGELLHVTGNPTQARRFWAQALAIEPKHKILNSTLKRLNIKL